MSPLADNFSETPPHFQRCSGGFVTVSDSENVVAVLVLETWRDIWSRSAVPAPQHDFEDDDIDEMMFVIICESAKVRKRVKRAAAALCVR